MMRKVLILIFSLFGQSVIASTVNQTIINPEFPRDLHGFRLSGIPNAPRVNGPVMKISKRNHIWYYDKKGRPVKHVRDPGEPYSDESKWRYNANSIRPNWSSREGRIKYDSHGNPDYILNSNTYRFSSGPGNSVIIYVKGGNGITGQRWTYRNGHIVEHYIAGGGTGFGPNGATAGSSPETRMQYDFDVEDVEKGFLVIRKRTFENGKLVHAKKTFYNKRSTANWVKHVEWDSPWGKPDKTSFDSFVRKYTIDKYGNWIKYKQCFPKIVDNSLDWSKLGDKKCRTVTRKIEYY